MGAVFARHFGSAFLLMTAVRSTLNTYSYPGPGSPVFDQEMGTITVLDNVRLELDIVFHSTPDQYYGVFQVGDNGNTRLPGLWYGNSSPKLVVHLSTTTSEYDAFSWDLEVGRTYHVLVELVDGVYSVALDGTGQSPKLSRTLFTTGNMPIWFADPYYDELAADCTVSNLVYETWDVLPITTTRMPTSTTLKPTTTTLKPTTTTLKPTTTTLKPTTTTLKPSSTTPKPTTTTLKPMTTTLKPTTTTLKPTTTTLKPTTTTLKPTTTTLKPSSTTLKPTTTTLKPTTTTSKPTTSTLKPTTTTTKPTTTSTPTPTDPITSTLLSTSSPTLWFSTSTEAPTIASGKDSNGGSGALLLYIAIGGAVFSTFLSCLGIWWLFKKRGKSKKDEIKETPEPGRVWSVSAVAVEMVPDVYAAEQKPERFEAFVPGSRRVSNLMRTGAVQLSGMQPMQKQRPSLLLSSNGSVLPASRRPPPLLPPPVPGSGGFLPPQPRVEPTRGYAYGGVVDDSDMLPPQPKAGVTRDYAYDYGGGVVETADDEYGYGGESHLGEGCRGEGEVAGEGLQTSALRLDNCEEFKIIVRQMKIDARTAEEKSTAKMLDLALAMEPEVISEEFQALVQMGIDTARINELLRDKAENILLAKGIALESAAPKAKGRVYGGRGVSEELREDSEELYDAGSAEMRGATAMGPTTLEALIAKKQLAAGSGVEKAALRKVRVALTTAPAKMEEEFRALLQMGASADEMILILEDTANRVLGIK